MSDDATTSLPGMVSEAAEAESLVPPVVDENGSNVDADAGAVTNGDGKESADAAVPPALGLSQSLGMPLGAGNGAKSPRVLATAAGEPPPSRRCPNPVVAVLRRSPLSVQKAAIKVAFLPSLAILRCRAGRSPEPAAIRWYDELERNEDGSGLIQGAFPLKFVLRRLAAEEGVALILSNCAEHPGELATIEQLGMSQSRHPTVDFACPSVEALEAGVAALGDAYKKGQKCYVHCKAGKGRATCMSVAFLTKHRGYTPAAAQSLISSKRPRVSYVIRRPGMLAFFAANGIEC